MGIAVEFNPDLALRNWAEHEAGRRETAECIPQSLKAGKSYPFLKKGQRNYWLSGELPLLETKGNEELSRPTASVTIEECTHFLKDGEPWTKGSYRVVDIFDDKDVHFESYARRSK